MNFGLFASTSSGPVVHIAPGVVFTVFGIGITNSVLYGWIAAVATCIIMITVARRMTVHPKGGFIQYVEAAVDFLMNTINGAFEDKEAARRYAPYFITLFFFILFNNWLSLIPIVGDGFSLHGSPLFRAFTGDLSATFAMGVITMLYVYRSSIRESGGFFKYINHFFVGTPKNPLYLLIGILEMISDMARVISLSLRLFLNVTIGEMVIAVFAYLGHFLAPVTALPFYMIEIFDYALQAYIFFILSTMYLAIVANEAFDHREEQLAEGEDGQEVVGRLTPSAGEV